MLTKLATKEWFTARISSAGLIARAYTKLTRKQQQEHVTLFAQLCRDDTPMVRRVAAQHLGTMLKNVVETTGRKSLESDGLLPSLFLPLYEELASNEQPVRRTFVAKTSYLTCFEMRKCSHTIFSHVSA